ncbi:hypothetical protein QCA50_015326 [Cerrena zonata]|uniref:Uncharacterized protein n=1 Tax=Cerrena zonata TaxID=2478898 RepID=A0AAW0FIQ5_9APHY
MPHCRSTLPIQSTPSDDKLLVSLSEPHTGNSMFSGATCQDVLHLHNLRHFSNTISWLTSQPYIYMVMGLLSLYIRRYRQTKKRISVLVSQTHTVSILVENRGYDESHILISFCI